MAAEKALADLIDAIDQVHGYVDLEAGCDGNGAVVQACAAINKPLPPNLAAWLKEGACGDEDEC